MGEQMLEALRRWAANKKEMEQLCYNRARFLHQQAMPEQHGRASTKLAVQKEFKYAMEKAYLRRILGECGDGWERGWIALWRL